MCGLSTEMESSGEGSPVAGRFGKWRGLRLVQVLKNLPSGANSFAAAPEKTALSNEPKIRGSEPGEPRVLKTA